METGSRHEFGDSICLPDIDGETKIVVLLMFSLLVLI